MPRRFCARVVSGVAVAVVLGSLGCASGPPPAAPGGSSSKAIRLRADWNDLDAAAEIGAAAIEAAVLSASEPEPGVRVFELRTVSDAPGVLEVRWLDAAPGHLPGENVELEARAVLGRFGDGVLEMRLLSAFQRRLERLRGRDVAPLD